MAILRLREVDKKFSGLQALSRVNLEIIPGERHAIIGPNGSGKSTLFNVITGFYKPSGGRIFFKEKDITGWQAHRIARLGLARSFQITQIFPMMTVFENVRNAITSKLSRRFNWTMLLNRSKEIQRKTGEIIHLLQLDEERYVLAAEANYGTQRQLEVAMALAWDPELIMLDEPTAGLDAEDTRAFVHLIREVTEGKTLLIVEHDMEVVFKLADRITVLVYGRVLATGTSTEIQENEEVRKAYLGRE